MWPPKLIPTMATAPVASSRPRKQVDGAAQVLEGLLARQRAGQLQAAGAPLVIGLQLDPGRGAAIEVGRVGRVAQGRDAIGDVAHVGGDAEHLHADDDAAAGAATVGLSEVAHPTTVACLEPVGP